MLIWLVQEKPKTPISRRSLQVRINGTIVYLTQYFSRIALHLLLSGYQDQVI